MKFSWYYLTPRPWRMCQHCFIGVGILYEDEGRFDIEFGLFFLVLGVSIDFGRSVED